MSKLPQLRKTSGGGAGDVRMYGKQLCKDEEDVLRSFNSQFIKKTHRNIKSQEKLPPPQKPAVSAEEAYRAERERLRSLVGELVGLLRDRGSDCYDLVVAFRACSINPHSDDFDGVDSLGACLCKQTFIAGLDCAVPTFSGRAEELFTSLCVVCGADELDPVIYLHQIFAIVSFARLKRGANTDEMVRAIIEGVAWEAAHCKHSTHSGNQNRRRRKSQSQRSASVYSVNRSKRTKKVGRGGITETMLQMSLPFPSVASALRAVCGRDTTTDSFIDALMRCAALSMRCKSNRRQNVLTLGTGISQLLSGISSPATEGLPAPVNSAEITDSEEGSNLLTAPPLTTAAAIHRKRGITNSSNQSLTSEEAIVVALDDVCVFASTQTEFQLKLQAEMFNTRLTISESVSNMGTVR
mmetsp:Transcript_8636/g.12894  ORF Transcript_8636/g.12894 Transcript_8636/m.12894 type:complete len:410 (+) Transcript_8636:298-1527(+)